MFSFFWNIQVIHTARHAASLIWGAQINHHGDELVPILLPVDQCSPIPFNRFLALVERSLLVGHYLLSFWAMKKHLSVLHCFQRSSKNNRSLQKECAMPDSEHPLLKEAFQHAESCYAEANAIVDFLDQAMENLQEEEPELHEAVSQSFIKADQFIDHCGE